MQRDTQALQELEDVLASLHELHVRATGELDDGSRVSRVKQLENEIGVIRSSTSKRDQMIADRIKLLQQEMVSAKTRHAHVAAKKRTLESKLQKAMEKIADLESKVGEVQRSAEQTSKNHQAALDNMRSKLRDVRTECAEREASVARAHLSQLSQQRAKFVTSIEKLTAARDKVKGENEKLTESVVALKQEVGARDREMEAAQLAESQAQRLARENADAESAKINQLTADLLRSQKMADEETRKRAKEHNAAIASMEEEYSRDKAALEDAQARAAERASILTRRVLQLEQERAVAEREVDAAREISSAAAESSSKMQKSAAESERKAIEQAKQSSIVAEKHAEEISRLETKCGGLETELEAATRATVAVKTEMQAQRSEIISSRQQLEDRTKRGEREISELRAEASQLKEEVARLNIARTADQQEHEHQLKSLKLRLASIASTQKYEEDRVQPAVLEVTKNVTDAIKEGRTDDMDSLCEARDEEKQALSRREFDLLEEIDPAQRSNDMRQEEDSHVAAMELAHSESLESVRSHSRQAAGTAAGRDETHENKTQSAASQERLELETSLVAERQMIRSLEATQGEQLEEIKLREAELQEMNDTIGKLQSADEVNGVGERKESRFNGGTESVGNMESTKESLDPYRAFGVQLVQRTGKEPSILAADIQSMTQSLKSTDMGMVKASKLESALSRYLDDSFTRAEIFTMLARLAEESGSNDAGVAAVVDPNRLLSAILESSPDKAADGEKWRTPRRHNVRRNAASTEGSAWSPLHASEERWLDLGMTPRRITPQCQVHKGNVQNAAIFSDRDPRSQFKRSPRAVVMRPPLVEEAAETLATFSSMMMSSTGDEHPRSGGGRSSRTNGSTKLNSRGTAAVKNGATLSLSARQILLAEEEREARISKRQRRRLYAASLEHVRRRIETRSPVAKGAKRRKKRRDSKSSSTNRGSTAQSRKHDNRAARNARRTPRAPVEKMTSLRPGARKKPVKKSVDNRHRARRGDDWALSEEKNAEDGVDEALRREWSALKANLIPELSGLHSRQSRSRVEAKLQRLRKRREKLETAAGLSMPPQRRRRVKTKKPVFR